MKKLLTVICLSVALTGCAHYVVHPGAANKFESVTYDTILTAKTLIDVSRDQFATGVLPARLKPLMNDGVIPAYNTASTALKEYDAVVQAGGFSDSKLSQLNAAMAALNKAIATFRSAK